MPKADLLKLRAHQYDLDALLKHGASAMSLMKNDCRESLTHDDDDKSISEYVKSESDALIEEFTQMWKSQFPDLHPEVGILHINYCFKYFLLAINYY